jgi:heme-degrading monooxygenase HmoA
MPWRSGATPATKSDEYLNLTRTVAIPDYRSTPGNRGAYALRRIEGDTAHFLMVTFWESPFLWPALLRPTLYKWK